MTSVVHEFSVEMTCGGCVSAVEKVLGKMKGQGIDKVDISLEDKKVSVTSTMSSDEVLNILKKTGKKTTFVRTVE